MANNLSDIVNVQIEIQTPAVSGADFSTLLLIGPAPAAAPAKAPPDVGVYTSLKAVKEAGRGCTRRSCVYGGKRGVCPVAPAA